VWSAVLCSQDGTAPKAVPETEWPEDDQSDDPEEVKKHAATPEGLTDEQAKYVPSGEQSEARIKAIAMDPAVLIAKFEKDAYASPEVWAVLQQLKSSHVQVDLGKVQVALDECNARNTSVASTTERFV